MVADFFLQVEVVHPQVRACVFQLILEHTSLERKRSSNFRHDDVCNVEDKGVGRRPDDESIEQSGSSEVERVAERGRHERAP